MCEEQMVRGGKVDSRKNFKKKFRTKDKGSDDSDEDYVVSSDENGASENSDENYCSYLDENASGEDNFVVEEEQQQRKKVRKRVGRKAVNAFGSCKERKKNGRERKRFSYQEEDDGDEDYSVDDDNDYEVEEEQEEEEDVDVDVDVDVDEEVEDEDEDEDEDEEFMLEEEDFSDEEEQLVRKRATNKKRGRQGVKKNTVGKVCKKRKPKAAKKPSRNKRRKKSGSRTLRNSHDDDDDDDFSDNYHVVTRRRKHVSKRKNHAAQTGLDTLFSRSSDYEYTISEEEREQMREAEKLCYHLRNRERTVPSPPRTEEYDLRQQRKSRPAVRKGKEKVEEVKAEVIKQVCGICLSEEDKRRVRGTLNSCDHFFCFSCIMEWAKVESRCPLCKQRFQKISKPARSTDGREVLVHVPVRDQVYQPSEEELRSYLDPYENVICIECQEGGDDNLMLLCDLCDSPAHTYCVGLGREVPEGNWYCVDCTTHSQRLSSPQPPSRLSDRRTTNNLFNRSFPAANREGLDLNSLSSPCAPNLQGFGNVPSPRLPLEVQSSSPMSQAVAPTLERRRIIRLHINNLRSSNQMGLGNNRSEGVSGGNPCVGTLSSQMGQGREITAENKTIQETPILSPTLFGENLLHGSPSPLMQRIDFLESERSHLSRQVLQDSHLSMPTDRTSINGTILNPLKGLEVENPTTVERNLNGALWPELAGVSSQLNCDQIDRYSNVLNTGSGNSSLPMVGDEKDYCAVIEHLQPLIESHLKNYLSRDDLGQIVANHIVMEAASTILATCGFKQSIDEDCRALPPSHCSHIDSSMMEEHRSLIKGLCSTCFDSYVRDVVKKITDDSWLNLSL